jgi:sentrin-specific protease 1
MAIVHLKNKTIRYYDSMGSPNNQVLRALEQYLIDESLDKKKQHFDTSCFKKENVLDCPKQNNGSDCGVFSCMFAEFISRDRPISFNQLQMPYFRNKMIYEIAQGKLML